MKQQIAKIFGGDKVIWAVIIMLSIVSILAVYSSTCSLAYKQQGGNNQYYLYSQIKLVASGFIVVILVHFIPYKIYSRLSYLLLAVSVPLLIYTLFKGDSINNASRWITLPVINQTFQTSDFAKIAVYIYIAKYFAANPDNLNNFRHLLYRLGLPIGLIAGLIMVANGSTALLLLTVTAIMIFIAGTKFKYIAALAGVGIVLVMILIGGLLLSGSEQNRFDTWISRFENFFTPDEEKDNDGVNFQAEQAKIAIATGGTFGLSPGKSVQRNHLPHPYSDFIFAIIVEEYGFIGGFIVILLYITLLYRAGVTFLLCKHRFPAYLIMGLTIGIVFQALAHIAVNVGILPVTGQTLPLISKGGTSILMTSGAFGIILSISKYAQNQEQDPILITEEELAQQEASKNNDEEIDGLEDEKEEIITVI